MAALEALNEAVVDCRRCPRLVEWREQVAREKRAAFRDWDVLGPADAGLRRSGGAGADPRARAGGARRQPDRAGSSPATARATSCSPALHRVGLANQAESVARDDGLRLHGAYIVAAVRCAPPANLPTPEERANCAEWLEREVALLPDVHVVRLPRRLRVGERAAAAGRARRRAGAAPEAEVRPRRGRRRRAVAAARLLSPQPAEHVHRQADAGDDGRGARAGARRSPGAREALRRDPALAATCGALVASSLLARLPIGINALAIVLYLREQTGLVRGRGRGVRARWRSARRVGAPVQGRLVDRHRRAPRAAAARVRPRASRWARSSRFAELGAPTVVLLVCGFIGGLRDPADLVGPALACGPTCSSRACTRRPTRWTRR